MKGFHCPRCGRPLQQTSKTVLTCREDGLEFNQEAGVWDFLLPERKAIYARFLQEYEAIREGEGRRYPDSNTYRALPFFSGPSAEQEMWKMRAASFRAFSEVVLAQIHADGTPLRILDLGAGNGWLSNQLAALGNTVFAVDLLTNDWDGLGAHRHYTHHFTPVRAEFDALPFGPGETDLAVFNAALHYSADSFSTIQKVLGLLRRGGRIAVIDTPVYRDGSSGSRMVQERQAFFQNRFGFRSEAVSMQNFLTMKQVEDLDNIEDARINLIWPNFGLRRRLRNLYLKLRGHREPAGFPIIQIEKI